MKQPTLPLLVVLSATFAAPAFGQFLNLTNVHSSAGLTLNAVATSGSNFVAVGNIGKRLRSLDFSADANSLSWEEGTASASNPNLRAIEYASGSFVTGGQGAQLFTSENGSQWTAVAGPFSVNEVRGLAFDSGVYIAVGQDGIRRSQGNPSTWGPVSSFDPVASPFERYQAVVPVGAVEFATGSGVGTVRISDSDGQAWVRNPRDLNLSNPDPELRGIAAGAGRIIAVGRGGYYRVYQGTTTTAPATGHTLTVPTDLNAITYVNGKGFVAVGNAGWIFTSADGSAWTSNSVGVDNLLGVTSANSGPLAGVVAIVGANGAVILGGDAPPAPTFVANQTVCLNQTATLTVTVPSTATVDWQNEAGEVAPEHSASYSVLANSGGTFKFFAVARDRRTGFTSATRTEVQLTVNVPPQVTLQPQEQTVCELTAVSFTSAASGSPAPTVQWQRSVDGGANWNDIDGATSPTLSFVAQPNDHGNQYRAMFANVCEPAAASAPARLNVNLAPVVTAPPANATRCVGTEVVFTAAVSGRPTPSIQWETSSNGIDWTVDAGADAVGPLRFSVQPGDNGRRYRAKFTNPCGTATTTAALLTVNVPPTITAHPANATACQNSSGTFTAAATGTPAPGIVWQISVDGNNWTPAPGTAATQTVGATTTSTLTVTAALNLTGNKFRAVFSNECGDANSNSAQLAVNPSTVAGTIAPPSRVCQGSATALTLSGQTGDVVRWESSPDGNAWTPVSGSVGQLSIGSGNLQSATSFRAVVKSGVCDEQTTAPARVEMDLPSIPGTVSATASELCAGASVTLNLTGQRGTVSRWEVAVNGGTYTTIANSSDKTSLIQTPLVGTILFRAVVANGECSVVPSAPVTVEVVAQSVAGPISPAAPIYMAGQTLQLTLSGQVGNVAAWQIETNVANVSHWVDLAGTAGATAVNVSNLVADTKYRVIVTNGVCAPVFSAPVTVAVVRILNSIELNATRTQATLTFVNASQGMILQRTPGLTQPGWQNVLTLTAGQNSASINITGAESYFRLLRNP
jgi:hypothetical protein